MDRESILKQAKRHMFKQGKHGPLVFIKTNDQEYCLPINDTDRFNISVLDREKVLFIAGRDFAQRESIADESILALYFVQEFWFVWRGLEEIDKVQRPSKEPDRRECLGVIELLIDLKQHSVEQNFYRSEILRHGDIINLGPSELAEEVQSNLLTCFLTGVASARYNDREFESAIQRYTQ